MEEFVSWHSKHAEYVQKVSKLMSTPLHDEPELLIRQAEEIEAHYARIGFLLADANGWLDRAKDFNKVPRDWGTEADRKSCLDAIVSPVRVVRDKLESLLDAIKQRVILSESLLRYQTQFRERVISEARK